MIRKNLTTLFVAVSIFFYAGLCYAQETKAVTPGVSDISISVFPKSPAPYEQTTISLQSFSEDLTGDLIEWKIDGKTAGSAIGKTSIFLSAKGPGMDTAVTAVVTTAGKDKITKTLTVSPISVDVLWQATDSVVPPMYKGKAMPSSEASVKFVAIPSVKDPAGNLINPSNFIYNWLENYTNKPDDSGYGKNFLVAKGSTLHPELNIGLNISNRDKTLNSSKNISLSPGNPFIIFYANSPLYGPLFNQSLGSDYTVGGSEVTIFTEPYFFSSKDPASSALKYDWTLNGSTIDTPATPNVLFLHRDNNSAGEAEVGVTINSVDKLFQATSSKLTLHLQ